MPCGKVDPTIKLISCGAMPDTMICSKESLSLGTNLVPPYLSPCDWSGKLFSNYFNNFEIMSDHLQRIVVWPRRWPLTLLPLHC